MFLAYCYPIKGDWHTPATRLSNEECLMNFIKLQHGFFQEIRITDLDDFMIIHIIDHIAVLLLEDGKYMWLDLVTGSKEIKDSPHPEVKEGVELV